MAQAEFPSNKTIKSAACHGTSHYSVLSWGSHISLSLSLGSLNYFWCSGAVQSILVPIPSRCLSNAGHLDCIFCIWTAHRCFVVKPNQLNSPSFPQLWIHTRHRYPVITFCHSAYKSGTSRESPLTFQCLTSTSFPSELLHIFFTSAEYQNLENIPSSGYARTQKFFRAFFVIPQSQPREL